ncbi:MAG: Gfo/Idh/MocA family oxidoreductase [Verrucomicrobiota bacterium]
MKSRRAFIQSSSTGLAAILAANAAPSILKADTAKPQKKLGLAIVGLGGYAQSSIAPELASCEHVQFAGAVTGDPKGKGKEWAKQYGFAEDAIYDYDNFDKIANDDRIQIVHITLPNSMHAAYAIRAAKAGKHIMVEKPMATSSKDCEAIIAAAKKAGVRLGVNYRLHWEPHHLKAIELVQQGRIGDLACGNYEFSWGYASALTGRNKDNIKKWLLNPKMAGGGALFDTGVYAIQAACYFTGKEPVSVRGLPAKRHPELFPEGIEETMSFEMLFDDGFQAICRASYSHRIHQCATMGSKGMVEILPGIRPNNRPGSVFGQSGNGSPNPKKLEINGKDLPLRQTLQQATLLDAFSLAIQNSQKTFKTPGEMGLRDIRIIEAIYQSAAKGGATVTL